MTDIKQTILEKIEKEGIKPKPRWIFSLREISLWSLISLSVIVAGIIAGILVMIFSENDWRVYQKLGTSLGTNPVAYLPAAWTLLLILVIFLVAYEISKTRRGYTRRLWVYLLASLSIGIMLGITLNQLGYSQKVDTFLDTILPSYIDGDEYQASLWSHPQRGLLAGDITSIDDEADLLTLQDLNGKDWIVDISNITNRSTYTVDDRVRILGVYDGPSFFEASDIKMWR